MACIQVNVTKHSHLCVISSRHRDMLAIRHHDYLGLGPRHVHHSVSAYVSLQVTSIA